MTAASYLKGRYHCCLAVSRRFVFVFSRLGRLLWATAVDVTFFFLQRSYHWCSFLLRAMVRTAFNPNTVFFRRRCFEHLLLMVCTPQSPQNCGGWRQKYAPGTI